MGGFSKLGFGFSVWVQGFRNSYNKACNILGSILGSSSLVDYRLPGRSGF